MTPSLAMLFKQKRLLALLAVVVVLLGLALWQFVFNQPRDAALSDGMPTSPAIEEKYGVRFTQIGVTADGGMVDVRYKILDPDKAMALMGGMSGMGDESATPELLVEGANVAIENSEVMSMKQLPEPGSVQFILYANPKGIVVPGTRLTIIVGNLRLEHVVAQ